MLETKYKSPEELRFSIGEGKKVAVISCGACANLCDTGGVRGMNFIKGLVEDWGNHVVAARTAIACCPVPIMKEAQGKVLGSSGAEVLVVISCSAGVKAAVLCNPGIPVVAACDTLGPSSLMPQDGPVDEWVANSLCQSCGHCVISHTAGICPVVACPLKNKYGPCKKAPQDGTQCAVDPSRSCVWREIERRGADLQALQELKCIHEDPEVKRIPSLKEKSSNSFARWWVRLFARLTPGRFLEIVHWAR